MRRLFDNLKRAGSPAPYLQFFIGKIVYGSEAEIEALMRDLTFADVAMGGLGDKFARLLCVKREAFRHEEEVRLLFQDADFDGAPRRGVDGVFAYPLDPHAVFDEVILDPRLEEDRAINVKKRLATAGCRLPVEQSALYRAPHFVIPIG